MNKGQIREIEFQIKKLREKFDKGIKRIDDKLDKIKQKSEVSR